MQGTGGNLVVLFVVFTCLVLDFPLLTLEKNDARIKTSYNTQKRSTKAFAM